mmetsp:Transcript_117059/g.268721  ORF Transcript_117059/g.268721 Transcript_117059/m.268721 type:complete len:259 (-) Transcript_117059:1403-2179(-)
MEPRPLLAEGSKKIIQITSTLRHRLLDRVWRLIVLLHNLRGIRNHSGAKQVHQLTHIGVTSLLHQGRWGFGGLGGLSGLGLGGKNVFQSAGVGERGHFRDLGQADALHPRLRAGHRRAQRLVVIQQHRQHRLQGGGGVVAIAPHPRRQRLQPPQQHLRELHRDLGGGLRPWDAESRGRRHLLAAGGELLLRPGIVRQHCRLVQVLHGLLSQPVVRRGLRGYLVPLRGLSRVNRELGRVPLLVDGGQGGGHVHLRDGLP